MPMDPFSQYLFHRQMHNPHNVTFNFTEQNLICLFRSWMGSYLNCLSSSNTKTAVKLCYGTTHLFLIYWHFSYIPHPNNPVKSTYYLKLCERKKTKPKTSLKYISFFTRKPSNKIQKWRESKAVRVSDFRYFFLPGCTVIHGSHIYLQ